MGSVAQPPAPRTIDELEALAVRARRCRVCGCSDHRPCPGGCAWVGTHPLDPDWDLCTRCVGAPGAGW